MTVRPSLQGGCFTDGNSPPATKLNKFKLQVINFSEKSLKQVFTGVEPAEPRTTLTESLYGKLFIFPETYLLTLDTEDASRNLAVQRGEFVF